jgi:hypothetical protein
MLNIQDGMNYIREVAVQKKNMMKSSQLECMIQFHTFIIDKYLLFSSFHNFSSINNDNNSDNNNDDDDEKSNHPNPPHDTHKGIEQLLSMKILSQLQSNNNDNNNVTIITTTTTTTSPLHTTPISTTTITGAINLSIDSIRSSLISFQKLQYIVVTTSQKLLFSICFSYGFLVWNIFNYNNTFIITNSNRNDDDSNKNAGNHNHKYNSSTYFNEKNLVDDINDDISHHNHLNFDYHQQQYQQIIALSLIEIMETLFYFFKYSKLKIKLQAVRILLFIVTKFIEINASNNNVDNNSGVRVDDIKDNNDDFNDKIMRFFFYSQEFFISFLLR